jgi:hypothetical protein
MLIGLLPAAVLAMYAYDTACRIGHCHLTGHPHHTTRRCPRCRRRT